MRQADQSTFVSTFVIFSATQEKKGCIHVKPLRMVLFYQGISPFCGFHFLVAGISNGGATAGSRSIGRSTAHFSCPTYPDSVAAGLLLSQKASAPFRSHFRLLPAGLYSAVALLAFPFVIRSGITSRRHRRRRIRRSQRRLVGASEQTGRSSLLFPGNSKPDASGPDQPAHGICR